MKYNFLILILSVCVLNICLPKIMCAQPSAAMAQILQDAQALTDQQRANAALAAQSVEKPPSQNVPTPAPVILVVNGGDRTAPPIPLEIKPIHINGGDREAPPIPLEIKPIQINGIPPIPQKITTELAISASTLVALGGFGCVLVALSFFKTGYDLAVSYDANSDEQIAKNKKGRKLLLGGLSLFAAGLALIYNQESAKYIGINN